VVRRTREAGRDLASHLQNPALLGRVRAGLITILIPGILVGWWLNDKDVHIKKP